MTASLPLAHLGVDGRPCAVHGEPSADAVMTFAVIGSRVTSFNHDIASKLQGLMMALDEMHELLAATLTTDVRCALETAQTALVEATACLSQNRALTRTTTRTRAPVRQVIETASQRFGITLRGAVPEADVEAAIPLLAHGIGLALDAIAGAGRARALDVVASASEGTLTLELTTAAEARPNAADALGLAAFVVAGAGGALHCRDAQHLVVRLPIVA